MNNLSSYCGLVDAKIRASDKDLPVTLGEDQAKLRLYYILQPHVTYILTQHTIVTHSILLGFHAAQKAFLSTDTYQGQVYFTKGSFFNYVDKMRKVL